jgi:hypothetical protein
MLSRRSCHIMFAVAGLTFVPARARLRKHKRMRVQVLARRVRRSITFISSSHSSLTSITAVSLKIFLGDRVDFNWRYGFEIRAPARAQSNFADQPNHVPALAAFDRRTAPQVNGFSQRLGAFTRRLDGPNRTEFSNGDAPFGTIVPVIEKE